MKTSMRLSLKTGGKKRRKELDWICLKIKKDIKI